jgi:hypothetical protein
VFNDEQFYPSGIKIDGWGKNQYNNADLCQEIISPVNNYVDFVISATESFDLIVFSSNKKLRSNDKQGLFFSIL